MTYFNLDVTYFKLVGKRCSQWRGLTKNNEPSSVRKNNDSPVRDPSLPVSDRALHARNKLLRPELCSLDKKKTVSRPMAEFFS